MSRLFQSETVDGINELADVLIWYLYELSLPMSTEKRIKANTQLDIQRMQVINVINNKYFKLNVSSNIYTILVHCRSIYVICV
jgi:NADPH-dependent 7-cyano-7-deazaguanine reductase QueF-like protein